MNVQTFYLGCLAQASYLIADGGEAVVIDPRRDVDEYLAAAQAAGARITHVVETHFHADFVSGHRELARRTGARIALGRAAGADYPHLALADGDAIRVGALTLETLETPGHTPESICLLLRDADGAPRRLFTGDTLFIGDVGRPDLVGARGLTPEVMAGQLFDSLHGKLLPLPDAVILHPGHGAGSACGKNISREITATLGDQRRLNPLLRIAERGEFIRAVTAGLPPAPVYFAHDAALNKAGPAGLDELPAPPALAPETVRTRARDGALLLDVRGPEPFTAGHVPGSLAIGLEGQFAPWAGALVPVNAEVILIGADEAQVREARLRLARVGIERVGGFLAGGVDGWRSAGLPVAVLPNVDAAALPTRLAAEPAATVIDVRRPGEFAAGHVPGARSRPLDGFAGGLPEPPAERGPVFVICAGGYRSVAAASLLLRAGWTNLVNVRGGTGAWLRAGHEVEGEPGASCSAA